MLGTVECLSPFHISFPNYPNHSNNLPCSSSSSLLKPNCSSPVFSFIILNNIRFITFNKTFTIRYVLLNLLLCALSTAWLSAPKLFLLKSLDQVPFSQITLCIILNFFISSSCKHLKNSI